MLIIITSVFIVTVAHESTLLSQYICIGLTGCVNNNIIAVLVRDTRDQHVTLNTYIFIRGISYIINHERITSEI